MMSNARNDKDELVWAPDAQQRLERAPAGFMRDCTRALIEKHAKAKGVTTITLDIANEGLEQAKETMEDAMKHPERLEDVLKNIMGSVKS